MDKSLFDSDFSSSCEPMILTLTYGLLKEKFKRQGVRDCRKQANREVARIYKFEKEKKKIQRKIKINSQEKAVARENREGKCH